MSTSLWIPFLSKLEITLLFIGLAQLALVGTISNKFFYTLKLPLTIKNHH